MVHHSSLPFKLTSDILSADQDPTAHRNRIPAEEEIPDLKSAADFLSHSFGYVNAEMERAQAVHEALLLKHKQQFQELKATESRIAGSNTELKRLGSMRTGLGVECANVAGTLHPIRRYPSDVLQYLFESVCDMLGSNETGSVPIAIRLSSVCRRWRAIALETPRLWCHIDFSMAKENEAISEFWNPMVRRIKSVPTSITLRYLDLSGEPVLSYCGLNRIPVISKLSLHLVNGDDFGNLIAYPDCLPAAGTTELHICVEEDYPFGTPHIQWDMGALLNAIPHVSSIDIGASCTLRLTPSAEWQYITTMSLSYMSDIDVFYILSAVTRLSSLEFHIVGFAQNFTNGTATRISTSLRHLGLGLCAIYAWWLEHVSFPNLISFFHEGGGGQSEECLSFIKRHPSITKLDLDGDEAMLRRVADIAPHIRSLSIDEGLSLLYTAQAAGVSAFFPVLRKLKVNTRNTTMTLDDFEGIVKGRCLHRNHPKAQIQHPLRPLRSFVIERDPKKKPDEEDEPWRTSDLFRAAKHEISPELIRGLWQDIALSWV